MSGTPSWEGIANGLRQLDSHDFITWYHVTIVNRSTQSTPYHNNYYVEVQILRPSWTSEAWIIQADNRKHYKVVEISGRRTILPRPWLTAPPSIARKLLWNLVFWFEVRRDREEQQPLNATRVRRTCKFVTSAHRHIGIEADAIIGHVRSFLAPPWHCRRLRMFSTLPHLPHFPIFCHGHPSLLPRGCRWRCTGKGHGQSALSTSCTMCAWGTISLNQVQVDRTGRKAVATTGYSSTKLYCRIHKWVLFGSPKNTIRQYLGNKAQS